jgi:hypothetical protein
VGGATREIMDLEHVIVHAGSFLDSKQKISNLFLWLVAPAAPVSTKEASG